MEGDENTVVLTEQDLERIIERSVDNALKKCGLDPDNPDKLQRNFQRLNEWVETTDVIKRQTLIGSVTLLLAGAGATLWMGLKQLVNPG